MEARSNMTPQAQGNLIEALQILQKVQARNRQNVRDTAVAMRLLREAAQVPECMPVWLFAEAVLQNSEAEELQHLNACNMAQK